MCKSTESLNVKNSSEQAGLAHQTSLNVINHLQTIVKTAVRLQNDIDSLYKIEFVKDLYIDDLVSSDQGIHKIVDTLSDITGRAYVEMIRTEVANG